MKRKLKSIIALLVFSGYMMRSQDFHLSLYDAGPLFLNPALTGVIDAKYRVHAQYRNQWSAVAFKPFTTALLSFDMPKKKWGYGFQVINMRAGIGNYNVFQATGSLGYSVALDKNHYHDLCFGLQGGFTQKSVEYKLYSFDEQYSTKDGGFFDKSTSSGENFVRQSQLLPQLNAGLLYYYSKQQSRMDPFIGVSAFNLTNSRETFFDQNNHLPIRINVHAGVRINLSELLYILPKALYMQQAGASEQSYALDAGYFFKEEKFFVLAGFVYRAKDASIANIGFRKENYIFKIGYDFNTSSLKTATKTRGAFEISFTYFPGKEKFTGVRNCPRL